MLLGPSRCLRWTQANSSTRPLSAPPPSHSEQFVNSHVQGRYLDEADFWPILEAIEAMDVPLYIHPNTPSKQLIEPFLDRTLEGATRPGPSRRRGRSFHSRDAEPLFCSFACSRWRRQLVLGGLVGGAARLVQGARMFYRDHPISDAAVRADGRRCGYHRASRPVAAIQIANWQ